MRTDFVDMLKHIKNIDAQIIEQRTGTTLELARRLRITGRMCYHYLQIMKKLGAPIQYDRKQKTFYYTSEGNFLVEFGVLAV